MHDYAVGRKKWLIIFNSWSQLSLIDQIRISPFIPDEIILRVIIEWPKRALVRFKRWVDCSYQLDQFGGVTAENRTVSFRNVTRT